MPTTSSRLHETDFYAWTMQQALELRRFARTRPNLPLDLERIAEEIQDLGKSEQDAVYRLARQIVEHLLLIEHSAATEQRRHGMDEIDEFRAQTKRKLSSDAIYGASWATCTPMAGGSSSARCGATARIGGPMACPPSAPTP